MLVGGTPIGAHRGEADARVVSSDHEITVQREIGASGEAVSLHLRDDGHGAVPDWVQPLERASIADTSLSSASCGGKSPGSVSSAMKP